MTRASSIPLVCAAAAAAFLVACSGNELLTPAVLDAQEPTPVQFTHQALSPETVRITQNGNVTWVNMADDAIGIVVFPASIAASFRCSDLRPYFTKAVSVYRSLPISDMESERVKLPCALAPGSYDYEIWIVGEGFGDEFNVDAPDKVLRGKILVE
jgi:hypothetical protein